MAAYASLVSLMHIIHQIENHPSPPISLQKQQVQSLTEVVTFLQEFLEGYVSPFSYNDYADPLEMRIADAAYAAEDVIESHIVNMIQLRRSSTTTTSHPKSDSGEGTSSSAGSKKQKKPMMSFNYFGYLMKPINYGRKKLIHNKGIQKVKDMETRCINFCKSLQKVIEDMDLIVKEVAEIVSEKTADKPQMQSDVASHHGGRKSEMVGFDDVLLQLLDRLTGSNRNRQIIPITGMGGIGKTTLARNAFENKLINEHFDVCLWATISQDYNIEQTLREFLSQVREHSIGEKSVIELGEELYKYLFGRRYLVVMDDMWSVEVWDKMNIFFPDNNNGSRVVVTTRLSNLAVHLANSKNLLNMRFLDEASSWNLFSKIVFGEECFPFELEGIGKQIVKTCKGLPLTIVVIGGLMAKSQHTQEYWEHIEKNMSSIVNLEDDSYCLRVLRLSYNHLPAYLKPCFLYMGVFEEDCVIVVSRLIKLWVSEGFLKPKNNKSLEAVAKEYLKELVERNLIIVDKLGSLGKIKHCKIHDLLRDLSLKEAKKERFCYVLREDSPRDINSLRRIVIPKTTSAEEVVGAWESMSHARSYVCYQRIEQSADFRLLRMLDTYSDFQRWRTSYYYSLREVFRLVNSRYLSVRTNDTSRVPSSINLLWNLHTLVIFSKNELMAPEEIWRMHQLEHVEFKYGGLCLPDLPSSENDKDIVILKNLQTLVGVNNLDLSEELARRIPNIKKLEISYKEEVIERVNCLSYLHCLSKLESLKCITEDNRRDKYLDEINFPRSLKKLIIWSSNDVELEHILPKIGSLPFLHTLWFSGGFFRTRKWTTVEGQFLSLKSLTFGRAPFPELSKHGDLEKWTMPDSSSCFPLLEKLRLQHFETLEEIPSEVGEIATLKSIELIFCSESAVLSAKRIVEEQEDLHGEELDLHVEVKCLRKEQAQALQYLILDLLRTLNTHDDFGRIISYYDLENVFELVNSRYLSVRTNAMSQVPSSINLLWNLHTLVILSLNELMAPEEIWRMHQLKHVEFKYGGLRLRDVPSSENDKDIVILKNLQTLIGINNLDLNEEMARRIPDIKKFNINYEGEVIERVNCLSYLHCLGKLESLECYTGGGNEYLQQISLPQSLKKVIISASYDVELERILSLSKVGSLPLLHTLTLIGGFFKTRKWETFENRLCEPFGSSIAIPCYIFYLERRIIATSHKHFLNHQ